MHEYDIRALLQQDESEYLDFKKEYHGNNVKLLHDILCLANSYHKGNRYLVLGIEDRTKTIFGVESDPNRKNNANIQDLLRQSNLNRIPSVSINKHNIGSHEVDVLMIGNRHDKPFFLLKDKRYQGDTLRNGVVYSRLGDTNIPLNETASEASIEIMWRERFGFDLPPLKLAHRLLANTSEWRKIEEDNYIYHFARPEFTIQDGNTLGEKFVEPWSKTFPDKQAQSFEVCIYYLTTLLYKTTFVHCDGFRYRIPLPERKDDKFYLLRDSIDWKIAQIYWQYYPLNEETLRGHMIELI